MPAAPPPKPPRHRVKAPPRPPEPVAPLPPELVASEKIQRAVARLTRGMTVLQQHHSLGLLAADIVVRSAILDAHLPLDHRQEQAAREYLAWCQTVDRPPVRYVAQYDPPA